jgi:hypothetical protein
MPSSGMLCRLALIRTDVSEKRSASTIRVTRIGEVGTKLAVTSNRNTLQRNNYVPPKRRFLREPHGVTYQKTGFFIVTAVKTANLTLCQSVLMVSIERVYRTCTSLHPTTASPVFVHHKGGKIRLRCFKSKEVQHCTNTDTALAKEIQVRSHIRS